MEYGTLKNFYDNLEYYLSQDITYMVLYEQTEVNYGVEEDCNIQYCIEHNIPCYQIERGAGCCVNASGSINIADVRSNKNGWIDTRFCNDFTQWLIDKGLNAETKGNDILVDGYKVGAIAGINLAPDFKRVYTCLQVSINQDLETIRNVCLKPPTKDPKGLSEYGITTQEVVEWLENWFKAI